MSNSTHAFWITLLRRFMQSYFWHTIDFTITPQQCFGFLTQTKQKFVNGSWLSETPRMKGVDKQPPSSLLSYADGHVHTPKLFTIHWRRVFRQHQNNSQRSRFRALYFTDVSCQCAFPQQVTWNFWNNVPQAKTTKHQSQQPAIRQPHRGNSYFRQRWTFQMRH